MLTSIGYLFLIGLLLRTLFERMKLPGLLGMLLGGILLGPSMLNILSVSLLDISSDLRQLALIIILTRAGLALDLADLKKVGRPAIFMSFMPACFEILGVILIAPYLLPVTRLEAAIMGSVIAAVSPAVVAPRMLKIMEEGYGQNRSIPQLILAASSVDDVFVIILFTAFTAFAMGETVSTLSLLQIPISILLGILFGYIVGRILSTLFQKFHMRDIVKVLFLLSISFLLIETEHQLQGVVPFSALLSIMSMGIVFKKYEPTTAKALSVKYNELWVAAEILLFTLVGAAVNLDYAKKAGLAAVLLIVGALLFRMVGVALSLVKTNLSKKERIFSMFAYSPKATVQAAIGAIPLSMGLACGEQVLTAAVLAILVTAPFGAICIDKSYQKLLSPPEK